MDAATAEILVTKKPFVVYATAEKVVGLAKMPFDGNPAKTMGLIAHPGGVSAIAVSGDAELLATAGGVDQTVNLWSINTAVVDAAEAASLVGSGESGKTGRSVAPFVAMLDGGEGGQAHEELIDYFYYAQLRTEGEDTTKPRQITNAVPLAEIPNLMRAVGYYPSEREVSNMVNEVKYADFTTLGTVKDQIGLDEFIALYVNHRPVFGVNKAQIEQAFKVLTEVAASHEAGGGGAAQQGIGRASGAIDWGALKEHLLSAGESLTEDDLATCLRALTGLEDLPEGDLSSEAFVEQVLGFEDYSVESKGE